MSANQERPEPSAEASEAIESARHARASSEAALPLAERMRDQVRAVVAANHFTDLMERTLREAARRHVRRGAHG